LTHDEGGFFSQMLTAEQNGALFSQATRVIRKQYSLTRVSQRTIKTDALQSQPIEIT